MASNLSRRSKLINRWTWWISSQNLTSAQLMVVSRSQPMTSIFSAPIQIKPSNQIRIIKICLILGSPPSSRNLILIACLATHPKSLFRRLHKISSSAFIVNNLHSRQFSLCNSSKIRLTLDSASSSTNTKHSSSRLILGLKRLEISHPHHSNSSKTRSTYLHENKTIH